MKDYLIQELCMWWNVFKRVSIVLGIYFIYGSYFLGK